MLFDNRKACTGPLRVEWLCGHVSTARKGKEVALSSSHAPPPAPAGASHPAPSGGHGGAPGPGHQAHVQKFCAYRLGEKPRWLLRKGRPVLHTATWANAFVVAGAWFPPLLVPPAALWAWSVFYLSQQVVIIPESCYAVVSDGGRFLLDEHGAGYVLGSGVHEVPFGSEVFLVRTNELVLDIEIKNVKLKDELILGSVKIQVTVKPDPRIAGDDHVNVFARWVREGQATGDDVRATHNVQHGLEAELMGKLRELLSEVDSKTFDESQWGFRVWLMACLTCHGMPHRESALGCLSDATGNKLLTWYQENAQRLEHWVEERGAEFAVNYSDPLSPAAVSHTEGHIGCSVDHVTFVSAEYTRDSLQLKQSQKTAQLKGEGAVADADAAARVKAIAAEADANAAVVKARADAEANKMLGEAAREVAKGFATAAQEHAERLKALGVTPDAAAAAGNAVVERGNLTGTVLVSNGASSVAVTGAGLAAGMNAVNPPAPPAGGTP